MQVTVFASGSGGNASLYESGGARVLVDGGVSARFLSQKIPALDAVVVTHAHGDHVAHAERIARRFGARLYLTEATSRAFSPAVEVHTYSPREPFAVRGLTISPTPLPHDAAQVGLVISDGLRRCAIVTDLGEVTASLVSHLRGCDLLLLESNHDVDMLEEGPYPGYLKKRILSARGHLSNRQAHALLRELYKPRKGVSSAPHTVALMHLSETNNTPALALESATDALAGLPVEIRVAAPRADLVLDAAGRPPCPLTPGPQQLSLW